MKKSEKNENVVHNSNGFAVKVSRVKLYCIADSRG